MSDIIRHVVIHGVVQGVGFRYWTEDTARRHGVAGWVRNRRDGTVEAVFAGSAGAVAAMIADCRDGPSSARVTRLDDDGFEQVVETILNPGAGWAGRKLHTLNEAGGLEFIDGSAMAPRWKQARNGTTQGDGN